MTSEQKQLNRTGIYLRLSKDDERLGESLSIDNQRLILRDYVISRGGTIVDEYIDDGYSGTNFDRPGIKRLLEDAKDGKIDTIIVKDLSRFGRNYIHVGQYIDYIFPAYGIRFIALNDNIDTADRNSSEMEMMPIKNLFNEWHSASTSKKIKAVLDANARAGRYTSGFYPYGYVVGNNEKRLPVVDEEAAGNVKRIFELRAQGVSPYAICRIFNNEHILSPFDYREKRTGKPHNHSISHLWNPDTVTKILKHPIYLGHLVQHRSTYVSYKNKKHIMKPESEWIVQRDTHEAIITQELWDRCREAEASASRGKVTNHHELMPLTGLLYCDSCGAKLKYNVSYTKLKSGGKIKYEGYCCRTYAMLGKSYCNPHSISRKDIENVVLTDIKSQLHFVLEDENTARAAFLRSKSKRTASEKARELKTLKTKQARLTELDLLIQSAFEEKVLKRMPESVCISLCKKYSAEKEELQEEVAQLSKKLNNDRKDENDVDEYIRRIKLYGSCPELTREMCLQLIECVVVDKHNLGDHTPRHIHIYYKLLDSEAKQKLEKQRTSTFHI